MTVIFKLIGLIFTSVKLYFINRKFPVCIIVLSCFGLQEIGVQNEWIMNHKQWFNSHWMLLPKADTHTHTRISCLSSYELNCAFYLEILQIWVRQFGLVPKFSSVLPLRSGSQINQPDRAQQEQPDKRKTSKMWSAVLIISVAGDVCLLEPATDFVTRCTHPQWWFVLRWLYICKG